MPQEHDRHLKPVLLMGYGERGAHWLSDTCLRILRYPTLKNMLRVRVIQVWHVADERIAGLPDDILTVAPTTGPAELRTLLDEGRSVGNRAVFPNLTLETMLVLERWSLFDPAVARRLEFQAALDRANRIHCEPSQVEEFFYDWISLADANRPAGNLTAEMRRAAADVIKAAGVRERIFLIDRLDANQYVIAPGIADRCFSEFARSLLTSDLAFPRPGLHVSTTFGGQPQDDQIIPFGIQEFEHQASDLAEVRGLHVARQIASGPRASELFATHLDVPTLLSLVAQEHSELATGKFSPPAARTRRRGAATELIRQALVTRDRDRSVRLAVETISRASQLFCSDRNNAPSLRIGSFAALGLPDLGLGALFMMALGGAAYYLSRSRKPVRMMDQGPLPGQIFDNPATVSILCEEWTRLCVALERFLEGLAAIGRAFEPGAGAWQRRSDNPYVWRLAGDPAVQVEVSSPDASVIEKLAQNCLKIMLDGDSAFDTVEIIRRAAGLTASSELVSSPSLGVQLVRSAFMGRTSRDVERFIRSAVPMVFAPAVNVVEVIWLTGAGPEAAEALREIEAPDLENVTRVLQQDDEGVSTRLCFGAPLRWSQVFSLHGIAAA
jgi:hypothetical protein